MARTISLSQQTLNKIATDAATETLKRTMPHASAPQQANTHYAYRAAVVPEHYKSLGDVRCDQKPYIERLFSKPWKRDQFS